MSCHAVVHQAAPIDQRTGFIFIDFQQTPQGELHGSLTVGEITGNQQQAVFSVRYICYNAAASWFAYDSFSTPNQRLLGNSDRVLCSEASDKGSGQKLRNCTNITLYLRNRTNIETVSGPCNTCFWYARAYQKHVLHGPETVSIVIANLRAIFNDILRKISTIFYAKTWDSLYCRRSLDVVRHWQWASLSCARILKFSQIDAIDYF